MFKKTILYLCLLFTFSTYAHALEYWKQNSTYFIRIPTEKTTKLSWDNNFPPKNNTSLIFNGTYFNHYDRMPIVFVKRWENLYFDQPAHLPPRPLLFLPLNDMPIITYDRDNLGRWNIGGGPLLLKNSEINVTCNEEWFKSDIKRSTIFTAIGVTNDGELIIIVTFNRSMNDIAWCFKYLDCTEAMRLDGGSSTYLYLENTIEIGNRNRCSNYFFLLQ
jgi:hypothetical protein